MGYFDRRAKDALPKAGVDALMLACRPHLDDLYRSGHLVIDAGLSLQTASVRTMNGKVTFGDGPLADTEERIANVFLIEPRDLDEAKHIASLHPAARMGEQFGWGIEIRPVTAFEER
jgi:hypothetical protein